MPHPCLALLWRDPRVLLMKRLSSVCSPPSPSPQLPQCLCIHLQRLSWSSHGTPLKRHEHVQFNEFLMMDIYKYRLLGHKPSQPNAKLSENPRAVLELQDGPSAPKPGVCLGTNTSAHREGIWHHHLLGPL